MENKMANAPLSSLSASEVKKLGLENVRICPGMGTVFCGGCPMLDEIPNECPVIQNPRILRKATHPCKVCGLNCPCKTDKMADMVAKWWATRV